MKKGLAVMFCLLLSPALVSAGDKDDFGTWLELGAEKALPHNLSVGLSTELRMQDNSTTVNRWGIGAELGYKVNKYFKLGASYSFLYGYNADKFKTKVTDHYKDDIVDDDHWNGYNKVETFTQSNWVMRHRFNVEANATVKLGGWLRISLRERYQYTHRPEQYENETKTKWKVRYDRVMDGDGNVSYQLKDEYAGGWMLDYADRQERDTISMSNTHILRTRLKLEVDKKRLAWSPFVSVETQNNLTECMHLTKVRTMVGTEYKINKHHSLEAAYVFTCETDEGRQRFHAVSVGYKFKF